MKRIISGIAIGAMVLGSVITFGMGAASAASSVVNVPTVVLSGAKGTFPGSTPPLVATSSVAGAVTFTLAGTTVTGCSAVATTTVTPFVATCTWTPTAAGPFVLGASFVPTDTTANANATATAYAVTIAGPIQGNASGPIYFTVDTVGSANNCGIQSSFVVGDGIVFRVSANDADFGGAALTSANVSSAAITVTGYATSVPLTYANHGGLGMWTGVLQTGTAAGNYSPTGAVPYTITMKTIAVPAVTKKITIVTHVRVKVGKKFVVRTHKTVKTVIVTKAVAGATGTFSPSATMSVLTLLAAPVTLK